MPTPMSPHVFPSSKNSKLIATPLQYKLAHAHQQCNGSMSLLLSLLLADGCYGKQHPMKRPPRLNFPLNCVFFSPQGFLYVLLFRLNNIQAWIVTTHGVNLLESRLFRQRALSLITKVGCASNVESLRLTPPNLQLPQTCTPHISLFVKPLPVVVAFALATSFPSLAAF